MKCECGGEVEESALAAAVAHQIDDGEVVESVECSACPTCTPGLEGGDGYVWMIMVE